MQYEEDVFAHGTVPHDPLYYVVPLLSKHFSFNVDKNKSILCTVTKLCNVMIMFLLNVMYNQCVHA